MVHLNKLNNLPIDSSPPSRSSSITPPPLPSTGEGGVPQYGRPVSFAASDCISTDDRLMPGDGICRENSNGDWLLGGETARVGMIDSISTENGGLHPGPVVLDDGSFQARLLRPSQARRGLQRCLYGGLFMCCCFFAGALVCTVVFLFCAFVARPVRFVYMYVLFRNWKDSAHYCSPGGTSESEMYKIPLLLTGDIATSGRRGWASNGLDGGFQVFARRFSMSMFIRSMCSARPSTCDCSVKS